MPNLISGMTIDAVNQVWAGDITYIRINNGFVFLAVLLDLYSRKIIGWAISKKIDRYLTLDALRMAIKIRKPKKGVVHHTDRGVQYLCDDYVKLLKENGFHLSCSRKGFILLWGTCHRRSLKIFMMKEMRIDLDSPFSW